jgi:ribosomal protein S18 acetylase RimI-like enzyme
MDMRIKRIGVQDLAEYAHIPSAFTVTSVFDIESTNDGLGGMRMQEKQVPSPYVKDYDTYDGGPERWLQRFDVSNWAFFLAYAQNRPVGGAVVAFRTPGVNMLAGRHDLAVLWDIRVHPDCRRTGAGTKLFRRAVEWSRSSGCRQLKIETQNVNVPACRFYVKQGCHLGEINRYAYAGHCQVAHEVMLVWYVNL